MRIEFVINYGLRIFLLEKKDRYYIFVLLGNEFSFEVDLLIVGCGVNVVLGFVVMDVDGGVERYKLWNEVGVEYGIGYCDGWC